MSPRARCRLCRRAALSGRARHGAQRTGWRRHADGLGARTGAARQQMPEQLRRGGRAHERSRRRGGIPAQGHRTRASFRQRGQQTGQRADGTGQAAAAEQHYRCARTLDPQFAHFAFNLGRALDKADRKDATIAELRAARALGANGTPTLMHSMPRWRRNWLRSWLLCRAFRVLSEKPDDETIARDYDYWCDVMGLPGRLPGEPIYAPVPYMYAQPAQAAAWHERVQMLAPHWSGLGRKSASSLRCVPFRAAHDLATARGT